MFARLTATLEIKLSETTFKRTVKVKKEKKKKITVFGFVLV